MMVDLQCLAWNPGDDNEEEKQLLPQLPHEFLVACMLRQTKPPLEKSSLSPLGPTKRSFDFTKISYAASQSTSALPTMDSGRAVEGVTLEDVEVEVFSIFVHWLYTQQMPTYEDNRKYDISEDFGFMLLKAYVFANRFLIADFERIVFII
ncbi:unnamed protein product [Alternaria alternata]